MPKASPSFFCTLAQWKPRWDQTPPSDSGFSRPSKRVEYRPPGTGVAGANDEAPHPETARLASEPPTNRRRLSGGSPPRIAAQTARR